MKDARPVVPYAVLPLDAIEPTTVGLQKIGTYLALKDVCPQTVIINSESSSQLVKKMPGSTLGIKYTLESQTPGTAASLGAIKQPHFQW